MADQLLCREAGQSGTEGDDVCLLKSPKTVPWDSAGKCTDPPPGGRLVQSGASPSHVASGCRVAWKGPAVTSG